MAEDGEGRMQPGFWRNRTVLVTGHTGFKGAWLCQMLAALGARVSGCALPPPTVPSLFELARVAQRLHRQATLDVRDGPALRRWVAEVRPEIVFHMAAQPLVRASYEDPVGTFETNVLGTVNLLEAVRATPEVRAIVVVTTDKCYENREWPWGYRENDALGGHDPYAASKACAELVAAAYRRSFFVATADRSAGAAVATARAGNVIGGGDWARDRLVPDCVRALLAREPIRIRAPSAVRPWQYVLEPLHGYLMLAERLCGDGGAAWSEAWNFGPSEADAHPVAWVVRRLCELWGQGARFETVSGPQPHETVALRLDCSKARTALGWQPCWDLDRTLADIVAWTSVYHAGGDVRAETDRQIDDYLRVCSRETDGKV